MVMNDKRISKDSYVDSPVVWLVVSEQARQDITPVKRRWRRWIGTWLWKLYEKTLRIILDALLDRMWPK